MPLAETLRKNYEEYLLATNKEEVINKLIPGTDQYYHLLFLHLFNKHGVKGLDKEQKANLATYFAEFRSSDKKKIELREQLIKYDESTKQADKL
jgi:hypothetical protein